MKKNVLFFVLMFWWEVPYYLSLIQLSLWLHVVLENGDILSRKMLMSMWMLCSHPLNFFSEHCSSLVFQVVLQTIIFIVAIFLDWGGWLGPTYCNEPLIPQCCYVRKRGKIFLWFTVTTKRDNPVSFRLFMALQYKSNSTMSKFRVL